MKKMLVLVLMFSLLLTGCSNLSQNDSNDNLDSSQNSSNNQDANVVDEIEIYYDSGVYWNKNWDDDPLFTYNKPVIRDKESAIEIAMAIYKGLENIDPTYAPKFVFYDEEDEIWIVHFGDPLYETLGGGCTIALQKKDGKVLRIWGGE